MIELDDFSPEWLAAYVDGELSPAECERVERWLEAHPEARNVLDGQQSLSPGNVEFWQAVAPPDVAPDRWDAICLVQAARRRVNWIGAASLAVTAAAILLLLPGQAPDVPPEVPGARLEVVIEEPYRFATNEEIRILSLSESSASLLVTGEHPLSNSFLTLARSGDIEFHNIGSDIAGRLPEVAVDPVGEDIAILWAPREP